MSEINPKNKGSEKLDKDKKANNQDPKNIVDKAKDIKTDNEDVEQELESIKNLVQTEVNKILDQSEYSDWNELVKTAKQEMNENKQEKDIQENLEKKDSKEKSEEKIKICECCNKNSVDTSENKDSNYCSECRKGMKEFPFNIIEIVCFGLVFVLIFVSMWQLSHSLYMYQTATKAHSYLKDGKYISASESYNDVNSQYKVRDKNPSNVILRYQAELLYNQGFNKFVNLKNFLDENYEKDSIWFKIDPKLKNMKKSVEQFLKLKDIVMQLYENNATDYNKLIKDIDKKIKEEKDIKFELETIDFWKFYVSMMFEKDSKTQLKYVNQMETHAPKYKTTYLPLKSQIYLNDKNYKKVIEVCDELIKVSPENTGAYRDKAIAYRLLKNTDKSSKTVNDGLSINSSDSDLNHQISILKLLDGKKEEALSYSKFAYQNSANSYSYLVNANMMAICAKLNGDEETYTQVKKEIEGYGYSLSSEVDDIVKENEETKQIKKLLENIFLKGDGEIKCN